MSTSASEVKQRHLFTEENQKRVFLQSNAVDKAVSSEERKCSS